MRNPRWDYRYTTGETDEILRELALSHAHEITAPIGDRIRRILVGSGTLYELCGFELDYNSIGVYDAIHARQCIAFFSKRADIDCGYDREAVARSSLEASERKCAETNRAFRCWSQGSFMFPLDVDSQLFAAQRKIANILGRAPRFSELKLRFGPGAAVNVKKKEACASNKLAASFQCSGDLTPIVGRLLEEMPSVVEDHLFWRNSRVRRNAYLRSSEDEMEEFCDDPDGYRKWKNYEPASVEVEVVDQVLCFALKNYKTLRVIAKQPTLNTMLQLGIGEYMAQRLNRFGIDLSDQSNNQRLARQGSLTGDLATLDLKDASNTMAVELVRHLLPPDWYDLLSCARCGSLYDPKYDKRSRLEMFSSMGNGFTFPLQSLLFYALTKSASEYVYNDLGIKTKPVVSVYGDDIIAPSIAYDAVERLLGVCGFTVNLTKSFKNGPFRESCGADFHSGINIRPVYVKDRLTNADLFVLHNFYRRAYDEERASLILAHIPEHLRIWGPDGFGDGHLIGAWTPKPHKRSDGWAGYTFDTFKFGNNLKVSRANGVVLPVYAQYLSGSGRSGMSALDFGTTGSSSVVSARSSIRETLPGTKGYKLISIYTLNPY